MADDLIFSIQIAGSSEELQKLGRLTDELNQLTKAKKDLDKQYKEGKISVEKYHLELGTLKVKTDAVKVETTALNKTINSQQDAFVGAQGSMVRLNQELGNMRDKYRALSAAERDNAQIGGVLLNDIQKRDAELKKLDATLGNHQRNIGNYPQALQGVIKGYTALAAGIAGFMAVAGGSISIVKSMVQGAMEDEAAEKKMLLALNGNASALERMLRLKQQLMENTTFTEDDIYGAINMGLALGRTESETRKMVEAAMGLSKAAGIDLQTAMTQLNGTYEGNIGRLARFDSKITDLTKSEMENGKVVDILREKLGKFATEGVDTAAGSVEQFSKSWKELSDNIGAKFLPVISKAVSGWNTALFGTEEAQLRATIAQWDKDHYGYTEKEIQAKRSELDILEKRKQIQQILDQTAAMTGKTDEQRQQWIKEQQEIIKGIKTQTSETQMLIHYTAIYNSKFQGELMAEIARVSHDSLTKEMGSEDYWKTAFTPAKNELVSTYRESVKNAEMEGAVKTKGIKDYYAAKGELSKKESEQEAREELKITLDVLKKKYDLLVKFIADRKRLGLSTPENQKAEEAGAAELFAQITDITNQLGGNGEGKKKGLTASMLEITDSEAYSIVQGVSQLATKIADVWANAQQQKIERELKAEQAKLTKEQTAEQKALDARRKKGLITEDQYTKAKEALDERYEKKRIEIEKQAFERQKKLQIVMAVVNGLAAAIGFLANPGGWMGIGLAAVALVEMGVTIAEISKQKFEYAKGGMVEGPDHARGGVKFALGGNVVELEGDEAVINKRSMHSNDVLTLSGTPRQIASRLNSYKGYGVAFSDGGYMPAPTPVRSRAVAVGADGGGSFSSMVADAVATTLKSIKVFVAETDISDTQNRTKKIAISSTW